MSQLTLNAKLPIYYQIIEVDLVTAEMYQYINPSLIGTYDGKQVMLIKSNTDFSPDATTIQPHQVKDIFPLDEEE